MLVCNVSLRPPRVAIPADIEEIAAAADATATGNVIFATLVDDPASVRETLDAHLGEIMLEAASAADALSAGGAYVDAVAEAATASATQNAVIALPGRSAMLPDVFVNPGALLEANVNGVMVNL